VAPNTAQFSKDISFAMVNNVLKTVVCVEINQFVSDLFFFCTGSESAFIVLTAVYGTLVFAWLQPLVLHSPCFHSCDVHYQACAVWAHSMRKLHFSPQVIGAVTLGMIKRLIVNKNLTWINQISFCRSCGFPIKQGAVLNLNSSL